MGDITVVVQPPTVVVEDGGEGEKEGMRWDGIEERVKAGGDRNGGEDRDERG